VSHVENPPAKGTRPRNRRAITVQVATELFYRQGYSKVTVADIALATNVGSSAIFRHFGTKSELLIESILCGLRPFDEALLAARVDVDLASIGLESLLRQLAELAIIHRELGVLWQREARNLDVADQNRLRRELRKTTRSLAEFIRLDRPTLKQDHADLLAWCVMSALVSVGFHSLRLPRDDYVQLLVDITSALARTDMADDVAVDAGDSALIVFDDSRKNVLISKAVELFAESGFGSVGVDDIGRAVGIAGPSVYGHFPSKLDILVAALERGNDLLRSEADAVISSNAGPRTKLLRLVTSYAHFAAHDRFLMRIVLSEMNQLDAANREFFRRQQHEYIERWSELLVACQAWDTISARIRVQAVLLVVCDAAQTPHLRRMRNFEGYLRSVGRSILGLSNDQ